jgi:hypothetical protein
LTPTPAAVLPQVPDLAREARCSAPVASLVQHVELNAQPIVNSGNRRPEGRDHPGAVLETGKAVTTTALTPDACLPLVITRSVVCAGPGPGLVLSSPPQVR